MFGDGGGGRGMGDFGSTANIGSFGAQPNPWRALCSEILPPGFFSQSDNEFTEGHVRSNTTFSFTNPDHSLAVNFRNVTATTGGTGLTLFGCSGGTTGTLRTGFGSSGGLNLQSQQQLQQHQQRQLAQGEFTFTTTPFRENQLSYNFCSQTLAQREYREASRRQTSTGAGPSSSSTFNISNSPAESLEFEVTDTGSFIGGQFLDQPAGWSPGRTASRVTCTRDQYYLKPTLEELDRMVDPYGNCVVNGLVIGRQNFGRIKYLIPVNVANINVDEIVNIGHKAVTVYAEDKNKPELGQGLNAPAEIELLRIWPVDKGSGELIRDPVKIQKMGYESKLRKFCNRSESEFISYFAEQGIWKFRVPHFSTYTFNEEDEDDTAAGQEQAQKGLGGISQQKLQQQRANMSLAASGSAGVPQPDPSAPTVKYKPILKDCGTEKSKLLKSVLSIDEDGDGDPTAASFNQALWKMSRLPMATNFEFPEDGQILKKRLSIIQGPSTAGPVAVQQTSATAKPPRGCDVPQVRKMLESELAIWELCNILWPGEENVDDDGFLLGQRQQLGEWLRKHASLLFGDEYEEKDKSVLGLLKKGLVEAASDTAIKEGSMWLSGLLESCPHLLHDFSDEPEVLEGMPKGRSDVFALISGNLKRLSWLTPENVSGMSSEQWLQHFALYIWFEGPVKSVANLAMHLLKLYSCLGHPMSNVLTPRTWTPDCSDYKLDWLLMRSLEEIGYPPGDEVYREICLHGFTGMLEGMGMWKWFRFVMAHIPGPEVDDQGSEEEEERLARDAFCQRLLERNIGEGMNAEENFLVYKMGVPVMLMYEIKSFLGSRNRADEKMWYLGNLERWQGGYGVLINYLESGFSLDLIGKRAPPQAKNIQVRLARLEENKSQIVGWDVQGKMVSNYLKILFENIDVDATDAAVINFMESVIKFKPVNTHQCAFFLDMALSAQKMIQLLLAEPEITPKRRARIEDNLVQFLEINLPKEYFDGLRCFINFSMLNNTAPFRVLEFMEGEEDDDDVMEAADQDPADLIMT